MARLSIDGVKTDGKDAPIGQNENRERSTVGGFNVGRSAHEVRAKVGSGPILLSQ